MVCEPHPYVRGGADRDPHSPPCLDVGLLVWNVWNVRKVTEGIGAVAQIPAGGG